MVDYAKNPAKAEYSDLQSVLHYAANGEKTEHGAERSLYVTGVNCSRDRAFQEMLAVQERFGKTGGNVAYHAYQSFKPGEVTPELCHQMGVELAKKNRPVCELDDERALGAFDYTFESRPSSLKRESPAHIYQIGGFPVRTSDLGRKKETADVKLSRPLRKPGKRNGAGFF